MKFQNYLLMFFFTALFISGCGNSYKEKGNGNVISKKFNLSGFNEIEIDGNYELILNEAPEFNVTLVTDDNLFQYIDLQVKNEKLTITNKEKIVSKDGIKLFITLPALEALFCEGAVVVDGKSAFKSDELKIELSGAGSVNLLLDVKKLEIDFSGAGVVNLSGEAASQQIKLSGVGNYNAYKLVSDDCFVDISGTGGAQVNVKKNLNAEISGAGAITYRGNPQSIEKNITGVGTIMSTTEDNSKPAP